jgi:hypothetical protein
MRASPAGTNGTYTQQVPIAIRQLDLERMRAGDNGPYLPGIDYLPIVRAFGLGTPDSVNLRAGRNIPAGALGAADAVKPADVAGHFPVFLAPSRANGIPDYQLWDKRDVILSYRGAVALFVATLDLMPRSFIEEMLGPRMELKERIAVLPPSPPIVALSRGAAQKAVGSVNMGLSYRMIEKALDFPAQNIVAVIEGSDPALKSEYVVLSAHLDHLGTRASEDAPDSVFNGANAGSGAIALLTIAEYFAAQPVKPKRSILFVWSPGSVQGLLGTEYFADYSTVPRDRIVASISVDRIARPLTEADGQLRLNAIGDDWLSPRYAEMINSAAVKGGSSVVLQRETPTLRNRLPALCGGDEWHFTRWGIPSVRLTAAARATDDTRSDVVGSLDFKGYTRATQFVAELAERIANTDARPGIEGERPDSRTACAR